MTNTGCKNIVYREKLNDYFVQISRDRKKFSQAFNTLEEAIDARDKAIQFYEEFLRIPSAKEIGLRRREHRMKNAIGERYISLDRNCGKRPYRLAITKNGTYLVRFLATLEEAVETRDEVLQFFKEHDRLPNRKEQEALFGIKFKHRTKHDTRDHSKSNTRMMNVYFNRSTNHYMIQLTRRQQKFSASSRSLEEAILIRDEVLKFYEDHGRLPSTAECFASIKKG